MAPRTSKETLFKELRAKVKKPPRRERTSNAWIRPSTWSLTDQKASLPRQGLLKQWERQPLVRKIRSCLKDGMRHRATSTGTSIGGHLDGSDLADAWRCLKGWYTTAEDRSPTPCHETMVNQTTEQEELHEKVSLPRDPIPINPEPKRVADECTSGVELWGVVKGLHNGRVGGMIGIRAEHIKGWLRGMKPEEKEGHGNTGAGDFWQIFVKLIHAI